MGEIILGFPEVSAMIWRVISRVIQYLDSINNGDLISQFVAIQITKRYGELLSPEGIFQLEEGKCGGSM